MDKQTLLSYIDKGNVKYKDKYWISVTINTYGYPEIISVELKPINAYTDSCIFRQSIQFINLEEINIMEARFNEAIEKMKETERNMKLPPIELNIKSKATAYSGKDRFQDNDNTIYCLHQCGKEHSKILSENYIVDELIGRKLLISGTIIEPVGYSFLDRATIYKTEDFANLFKELDQEEEESI